MLIERSKIGHYDSGFDCHACNKKLVEGEDKITLTTSGWCCPTCGGEEVLCLNCYEKFVLESVRVVSRKEGNAEC